MKFKMKSIASILVAAAMMVAMAAPVFAIGESGGVGYGAEEERADFDKLPEQKKITRYNALYKVNSDGTYSPFRNVTRDICTDDERYGLPYVVNMKLGETIRIECSNYANYFWDKSLVSSVIVQKPSEMYTDYPDSELNSIVDITAIAVGVSALNIIERPYDYAPGGIVWNITEDGSALSESEVTTLSENAKAEAAAKEAKELAEWEALSQEEKDALAAEQEAAWAAEQAEQEAAAGEDPVVTHYEGGESYTVQAGDTFGVLSLNNYGSYKYADALYAANAAILKSTKDGKIYKGLTIVIPETIATGVNRLAPQTLYEGEKLYTVKSEDTLGTIALAHYKDMSKYKAIFERNADRLKNANTIYAGQIIILP